MTEEKQAATAAERFKASADARMNHDDDVENDLWQGSYSPKAMIGSFAMASFISAAVLVAMFVWLRNVTVLWYIVLGGLALLWIYLVGLMVYRKLSMSYQLTSQRMKHREGILMRSLNRIELIDIDDVTYRQGPIQAILNVGNITIKSSDTSHPELIMYGISEVRDVADLIDDARRAERRKRGLHIEAV